MTLKERLTLGQWPPLVSHLSALILGCTFTYFTNPSAPSNYSNKIVLMPDTVTITLGSDWFLPGSVVPKNEGRPVKSVVLMSESDTDSPCTVIDLPLTLTMRYPHLGLATSIDNLATVTDALNGIKKGTLQLAATKGNSLPCKTEPKVNYGAIP